MSALQLVKADYDGNEIDFTGEGWFNATQAAAKFGKSPAQWLRLPATIEYLSVLNSEYGEITYFRTQRGKGGGTWMHPKLAVAFSRWLDTRFSVWCDKQIDAILRGQIDTKKLRHEAAASFKVMTQALQLVRAEQGKVSESHHYSNEARLINFALTGEFKGINRDELPAKDLDLLAKLEIKNTVLIGRGVEYQTRKAVLAQFAIDMRDQRLIAVNG